MVVVHAAAPRMELGNMGFEWTERTVNAHHGLKYFEGHELGQTYVAYLTSRVVLVVALGIAVPQSRLMS